MGSWTYPMKSHGLIHGLWTSSPDPTKIDLHPQFASPVRSKSPEVSVLMNAGKPQLPRKTSSGTNEANAGCLK